ncbi:DUF3613 domain-containing protein [Frateuria aurantia]
MPTPRYAADERRPCLHVRLRTLGLASLIGIVAGTALLPVAVQAANPAAVEKDPKASGKQPPRHEIGDTTHLLLELQASGRLGVPAQPILGDEAAASYKRYIDSFSHPIPTYFETMVGQGQRAGSSGTGSGL